MPDSLDATTPTADTLELGSASGSGDLVDRAEAAEILGYASAASLKEVMRNNLHDWPEPVACRIAKRALLWRRAEILLMAGAEPWVVCLICERRFLSLGPHLAKAHGISAAEYRSDYQLRATLPLMGDPTRRRLVETTRAAMDADPEWMRRMRAAMPPLAVIAQAATEARAATRQLAPSACRPCGRRS